MRHGLMKYVLICIDIQSRNVSTEQSSCSCFILVLLSFCSGVIRVKGFYRVEFYHSINQRSLSTAIKKSPISAFLGIKCCINADVSDIWPTHFINNNKPGEFGACNCCWKRGKLTYSKTALKGTYTHIDSIWYKRDDRVRIQSHCAEERERDFQWYLWWHGADTNGCTGQYIVSGCWLLWKSTNRECSKIKTPVCTLDFFFLPVSKPERHVMKAKDPQSIKNDQCLN